jgi:hypothetical protein
LLLIASSAAVLRLLIRSYDPSFAFGDIYDDLLKKREKEEGGEEIKPPSSSSSSCRFSILLCPKGGSLVGELSEQRSTCMHYALICMAIKIIPRYCRGGNPFAFW